jgi:hypothetical protein
MAPAKKTTAKRTKAKPALDPELVVPDGDGTLTVHAEGSGMPINPDLIIGGGLTTFNRTAAKKGKVSQKRGYVGIPMPSTAIRYLIQNDSWPLCRMSQFVGPQASFKSTFAVEVGRWHYESSQRLGRIVIGEAESKQNHDMRDAIVGHQPGVIEVEECDSLEDWQRYLWKITEGVQAVCLKTRFPDGHPLAGEVLGRRVPFCMIADSLTGKLSETTVKKIQESGHAQKGFATEAQLITLWLKAYSSLMSGWPISFIGINHLKYSTDPVTQMPVRRIPGGAHIGYQETFEIELRPIAKPTESAQGVTTTRLSFATYKNSAGANHKWIEVPVKTWKETVVDEATGREAAQQGCRFEWWEATVLMLVKMQNDDKAHVKERVRSVISVQEKSGGNRGKLYYSRDIGVPESEAMPAHDFGLLIERTPEIRDALEANLGIIKRPIFDPRRTLDDQMSDPAALLDPTAEAKAIEEDERDFVPEATEV